MPEEDYDPSKVGSRLSPGNGQWGAPARAAVNQSLPVGGNADVGHGTVTRRFRSGIPNKAATGFPLGRGKLY